MELFSESRIERISNVKPLYRLKEKARSAQKTIVLSEGADPRVVAAAVEVRKAGLARLILVGHRDSILAEYMRIGARPDHGVALHDPESSPLADDLARELHARCRREGMTEEEARQAVKSPHTYAALLVKTGHANGMVGGARAVTAEIVRTALKVIGPAPGTQVVSSFFLMLFCENYHVQKGAYVFSDCGSWWNPTRKNYLTSPWIPPVLSLR